MMMLLSKKGGFIMYDLIYFSLFIAAASGLVLLATVLYYTSLIIRGFYRKWKNEDILR